MVFSICLRCNLSDCLAGISKLERQPGPASQPLPCTVCPCVSRVLRLATSTQTHAKSAFFLPEKSAS